MQSNRIKNRKRFKYAQKKGLLNYLKSLRNRLDNAKKRKQAYDYHSDLWESYDDESSRYYHAYKQSKNQTLDYLSKYLNSMYNYRFHLNCMSRISNLNRPLTKNEEKEAHKVADDYMKKHYGHFYKQK